MSLKIKSGGINYNVPTVNDFPTDYLEEGLVCVVTDENQGGTFVYREDNALVNNGGTIFDGWTRQYDGAVNVKWFGAKCDGTTNDRTAFQASLNTGKSVYIPNGTLLFESTVSYAADGQCIFGDGNDSILKSGVGSVYISTNGFNSCIFRNLQLDGDGANGGLQINNSSNDTVIENILFYRGNQRVWIFTADRIRVQNCTFNETGYGVIQQAGQSSSHVTIDGNLAYNINADFVEANCTASAPSYFWMIINNTYDTNSLYPTAGTEERFVGLTGINGAIISNNTINKAAGDAAIHLEDIGGETVINSNVFDNCLGNNGYIYLLNSSEHVVITSNIFQRTDPALPTACACSVSSNSYANDVIFSNNRIVGNGEDGNFFGLDWRVQTGMSLISNNIFSKLTNAMQINSTSNVSFLGNMINQCKNGIFLLLGSTSNGGRDWQVSDNSFYGTTDYDIYTRQNTSGTGAPKRWSIKNNKFSKTVLVQGLNGGAVGSVSDAEGIQIQNNFFNTDSTLSINGTMSNLLAEGNSFIGSVGSGGEMVGSVVYNPPSISTGSSVTTNLTLSGVEAGDYIKSVSFSQYVQGLSIRAWISAIDTISVQFTNTTDSAIDLANGTIRVLAVKR
jgi:hypothetical protein